MNYLEEWQKSCVDPQLIDLNVTALQGTTPSDYLFYSDKLFRRNDGRLSDTWLRRYQHIEEGGWWCSGIDVMTGEKDIWGCFKPNTPRFSIDRNKSIKYEHPPQVETGIFALQVPPHLWKTMADRYGYRDLNIKEDEPTGGFWQWVLENPEIPLYITEGAKKAGALLTAGYVAIALPGINNGYRTPKDVLGNRIGKSALIPQLAKFAQENRKIYLVFDQDERKNTIKAVNTAIRQLGYLLTQAKCSVYIVTWLSQWGKGIDDVIAEQGQSILRDLFERALPLESWKIQTLSQLTYPSQIIFNEPYLTAVDIPKNAQIIAIKSPKGSGKTQWLTSVVKAALSQQKKVLVIGHRIKLVEALCQRFGLPYITQIKDQTSSEDLGYGLCIDSLHGRSQIQFNPHDWQDAILIIDEIEQVLWHVLNGETCKTHRVAILKSFKQLIQTILENGGRVYLADADLSDISLDYMIALAGFPLSPFIIKNTWKPHQNQTWKVTHYPDSNPKTLIKALVKSIREGEKPFICLSAQKLTSQWGTQTLETYLTKQFPTAKILRIDSASLSDPSHPAYRCIEALDQTLKQYDIVLASPCIETGISIDLKGHFTSVWCLAQGVQTPMSIGQTLSRIRENIPRHLWVANTGFNRVGNGSTSIPNLLTSGHRLTQLNIRLLQGFDLESLEDIDTGFQAESLLNWAKMAVRVNAGMSRYRESILTILREENHLISDYQVSDTNCHQLAEAILEVRNQNYQEECQAIANANEINDQQYQILKKRLLKSPDERRILRKYELKRRYQIRITPQLVILDDEGWYQKLRLHYFLTIGRQFLADRDSLMARKLIDQGQGSLFVPDFNNSQLGVIIGTMEVLGITALLNDPSRLLSSADPDLQEMANLALKNRYEIKLLLKIGLAETSSPITIIRRFLNLIGLNLIGKEIKKIGKKRVKTYQILPPNDHRSTIFRQWLFRDETYPGSSEFWDDTYWNHLNVMPSSSQKSDQQYIQLNLDLNS